MDNEEPYHHYSSPSGAFVSLPLVLVLGKDDGDDDVAGSHTDRSNDEDGLSTEFVNVKDSRYGGKPHDNSDDATGQQRRSGSGQTQTFKDLRSIIEHSVDPLWCSTSVLLLK